MNTFYIILIIIGYILMSAVTALILNRTTEPEKELCILGGIVWPLTVVWAICSSILWVVVNGIEWLANKWEEAERRQKMKSTDI